MSMFGCIRDKYDGRDRLMKAYLPLTAAARMPAHVDHSAKCSPVRDQGDEGTCVGFATTVGVKEFQELADYKKLVSLAPRYLYNECKKIDGMPDSEGTTIRVAMKVLAKKGVCRERLWPYKPHQADKARRGAAADAKKFRIVAYARILNLNELRMSMHNKGSCAIGVEVFNGMMTTRTGIVSMPGKNEPTLGGHAVCAVGYDDARGLVKFKNSWSARWGARGYGFLPYAYIEKHMMDAWSSVDFDDPNPLTLDDAV